MAADKHLCKCSSSYRCVEKGYYANCGHRANCCVLLSLTSFKSCYAAFAPLIHSVSTSSSSSNIITVRSASADDNAAQVITVMLVTSAYREILASRATGRASSPISRRPVRPTEGN